MNIVTRVLLTVVCALTVGSIYSSSAIYSEQFYRGCVDYHEFDRTVDQCAQTIEQGARSADLWLGTQPDKSFFNINTDHTFAPYAQKLIVPVGSTVTLWGDLHGNLDALLSTLQFLYDQGYIDKDLKILRPNLYLLFLGDYVDRGPDGLEVMYLLMRLKVANPGNVFMVRGNHEDMALNQCFGFVYEIQKKLGLSSNQLYKFIGKIQRFYDLLPVVLYLGSGNKKVNIVQCCHGGLELGYSPRELLHADNAMTHQLLGQLKRATYIQKFSPAVCAVIKKEIPVHERVDFTPEAPCRPQTLGFMWHDFLVANQAMIKHVRHRGWAYGEDLVRYVLNEYSSDRISMRAIIRAHQHNNGFVTGNMLDLLMANKGLVSLWDGLVYTLLTTWPLGGGSFHSCTFLTTAENYHQWQLKHYQVDSLR